MKQQDMVLDDVIQATKRLGEMGQTIGDELGQQSRLCDTAPPSPSSEAFLLRPAVSLLLSFPLFWGLHSLHSGD